jgi:hypothetical protein
VLKKKPGNPHLILEGDFGILIDYESSGRQNPTTVPVAERSRAVGAVGRDRIMMLERNIKECVK